MRRSEAESHEGIYDMIHEPSSLVHGSNAGVIHSEIEAAERNYQRLSHGFVHLPDGSVHVSEEMDLLYWIGRMEKTADRICSPEGTVIKRVKIPFTKDRFGYILTPLGKAVWTMCRTAAPLIEQLYPGCRKPARLADEHDVPEGMRPEFNPYITVVLHACQVALQTLRWCDAQAPDLSEKSVRGALDHLLRSIRRICRSRRFKYLESNYQRNAKKCLKASCEYLGSVFAENSKLLILRVDLYFLPDHKEWADTVVAGRCVKRFLRALREGRVVPDMKAWAARGENGFRRGIHLHVLVAMDGHKHRDAAAWSQAIGEAWVEKYSKTNGSYFNCYVRKDWYKFNGLGLVHIRDMAKLMGIREALRYMTKADFHIATGFKRNFWRGIVRRSRDATKRGAPRKSEHGMELVDRILGEP